MQGQPPQRLSQLSSRSGLFAGLAEADAGFRLRADAEVLGLGLGLEHASVASPGHRLTA